MRIPWTAWIELVMWIQVNSLKPSRENMYILVPHIPEAVTVPQNPMVLNHVQCSKNCDLEPFCQGFLLRINQTEPCTLLINLTGQKSPTQPDVQAYVTTYYNGVRYWQMMGEINWE
ncbi:hypothetical protein SK128_011698 [Halocaridina rubra]|uniref:Apple domain-containing protein n=1 Tax=Halocaridina rubra TaxID=373956 RepID=A0AAN8WS71_HALRR